MTYQLLLTSYKLKEIIIKTNLQNLEFLQLLNKDIICTFVSKNYWIEDVIRSLDFFQCGW